MDGKLISKKHHGGWLVGIGGQSPRPAVYSSCQGDAIRKLADANYAPETSTYQALMWYAKSVAMGNQVYDAPAAWDGSLREIKNAWYRKTQM